MRRSSLFIAPLLLCAACGTPTVDIADAVQPTVIEVATFKLKDGIDPATFEPLDAAVEDNHVSQQPGFVSRETGYTDQGEWLVIVHWESIADAEASMASFAEAPAAADFMANLDASTMSMVRYDIND